MEEESSSRPVLILPALHLILCLVVEFTISDDAGSWKWFRLGMFDFPIARLVDTMSEVFSPFWGYGIFGTLWWYGISFVFQFLYRKLVVEK
jgi:hypothetical protein